MRNNLSGSKTTLLDALDAATATASHRLDNAMALLVPPLDSARFLQILQRLWGFHRVWEPLVTEQPALIRLAIGRSKLALLKNDLGALQMPTPAIQALPLCQPARSLGGSMARLLGTMYVLERATLGGHIITRAVKGQAWAPAEGLHSFDPYGPQTGPMWQAMCAALESLSSTASNPDIIAGALDTFAVLQDWLCDSIK